MFSEEDQKIAEFGYKPVLKREFSALATFSFAFSISGLFSSIATTFVYPLQAGGAPSVIYCWLIAGAGSMCIALSVAELVSARAVQLTLSLMSGSGKRSRSKERERFYRSRSRRA